MENRSFLASDCYPATLRAFDPTPKTIKLIREGIGPGSLSFAEVVKQGAKMADRRGANPSGVAGPAKGAVQKPVLGAGGSKQTFVPGKDPVPPQRSTRSTGSTATSSQVQSSQVNEVEKEQPLDPRYKDMICFNCGGPGHYVGNCVRPKAYFICQQSHNVNNCSAWSRVQPTAAFFGSGASGLGFNHVEVPVANESKWINFQNCGVVNITKGEVDKDKLGSLLTATFCKTRAWPWQIRELSNKEFLVRFPPWKKVEDLIELHGFSLPQDVSVKMTEWAGSCGPFGELIEAWVLIEGIPPKWCSWKMFAQIASMFGVLTDVVEWHV